MVTLTMCNVFLDVSVFTEQGQHSVIFSPAKFNIKTEYLRDFPGGPMVKTLPSKVQGEGLIPGRGAKIPHALWPTVPKYKTEAIV